MGQSLRPYKERRPDWGRGQAGRQVGNINQLYEQAALFSISSSLCSSLFKRLRFGYVILKNTKISDGCSIQRRSSGVRSSSCSRTGSLQGGLLLFCVLLWFSARFTLQPFTARCKSPQRSFFFLFLLRSFKVATMLKSMFFFFFNHFSSLCNMSCFKCNFKPMK